MSAVNYATRSLLQCDAASTRPRRSLVVLVLAFVLPQMTFAGVPKIIFETDMTFDVDDVGALATLHALADRDRVEILGINYNEVHPHGPAAIAAINQWYGRGKLPIGIFKGSLREPDRSPYLAELATSREATNDSYEDAVDLTTSLLGNADAHSVTIVSVGFLNNLAALLHREKPLIDVKVRQLIVMAGIHNDGFNLVRHDLIADSQYVLEHWPTKLTISDYGVEVPTGSELVTTPSANPVRRAFHRYFDGRVADRPSWDQVAVLYGAFGPQYFEEQTTGFGRLRNGYQWALSPDSRTYVLPILEDVALRDLIHALMTQPPRSTSPE